MFEKEAEEKLLQAELDYCHELSNPCEPSELPYSELLRFETGYKRGYLASAEPREKRIAELKKENANLKALRKYEVNVAKLEIEKLEKENAELRNNGFTVSAMTEQQLKAAIEKGEQLEKENTELKDKLKNLASVAEVRLANWQKYEKENEELKAKIGLSIDCEKAQKNGELCLGYGGDEDEPCERCKNCIKCEGGYYQLGETEKDDKLIKAKEIIKDFISLGIFGIFKGTTAEEIVDKAEQFLKENK